MTSVMPNLAKGRFAYYATLPLTNDAIVVVPIKTAGVPTDAQFKAATSLADILAIGTENTTMGRKTLTNVTPVVDNTLNEQRVTADSVLWNSTQMAAGSGAVSKLVHCYVPDTTAPSNATAIPLVVLDCNVTPDGNAYQYNYAANGLMAATE